MQTRQEHWITSGDLLIHAVSEGNSEATPLVLVHGYPDNHKVWDQVTQLLSQTYRVIRYDVRGAGHSDKPRRTRDYRLELLATDLQAVVQALLPGQRFHLVAHDWGSIQSWESVAGGPLQSQIGSFTSISGPCLDHIGFWIRRQLSNRKADGFKKLRNQLLSSWYVMLFQVPYLAETIWKVGLDQMWPDYLKKYEQVANPELSETQQSDGQFGVKLYRANVLPRLLRPTQKRAQCPVQLIIPTQDNYVSPHLNERLSQWTESLVIRELAAPHWAMLTEPETVSNAIHEFVSTNP